MAEARAAGEELDAMTAAYPNRPIPSWNPDEIERNGGIEVDTWACGSVTLDDDEPRKPWPWQLPFPERVAHLLAEIARYEAQAARHRYVGAEEDNDGATLWAPGQNWSWTAARAADASAASYRRQLSELTSGLENEG